MADNAFNVVRLFQIRRRRLDSRYKLVAVRTRKTYGNVLHGVAIFFGS